MDQIKLPLDWIGIAEGTDKSSLGGDYLGHYEARFAAFRGKHAVRTAGQVIPSA